MPYHPCWCIHCRDYKYHLINNTEDENQEITCLSCKEKTVDKIVGKRVNVRKIIYDALPEEVKRELKNG